MQVKVDLKKCIKSGECLYNHPDMFKMGDDGYPVLLVKDINSDKDRVEAEQAAEVCPAQAITIE